MKYFKFLSISLIIIFFLSSCTDKEFVIYEDEIDMVTKIKSEVPTVTIDEFKKIFDSEEKFFLIDCREQEEYDSVAIPGAIHIPRGVIEFQIGNKVDDRRAKVYVYCSNGDRSALAVDVLPSLKFPNAYSIEGGFEAWAEKYPDDLEYEPKGDAGQEAAAAPPSSGGCGG